MDTKGKESLINSLREYSKMGYTPFHMPGHKRAEFDFLECNGIDITEIDGFDNLHNAKGILKDSMQFASQVFGTLCTRFLVGGSTCGILAGIRSLTKDGDYVLVARNCHKSVYNALELCRLKVRYVLPECENAFFASVTPKSVEDALSQNEEIKLVVITSPIYEGVLSDIEGIAKVCKSHGAKLFVDEAHGAHLGFGGFEKSARHLGADMVVESVHKTLPSLTQTALLHICSKDVDVREIDRNLAIFESSSPSYILMSAIDGCVRYLSKEGALDSWREGIEYARKELKNLKNIRLFDGQGKNVFAYDKSKFVFLCDECNLSGVEIAEILRKEYKIEIEMASENHLIAMTGAGDNFRSLSRLIEAIKEIDEAINHSAEKGDKNVIKLPQMAFYPYEIVGLNSEFVNILDVENVVLAENIWAYPPGCPILVKGEVINSDDVEKLVHLKKVGVDVSSEYGGFPNKIRIVKMEYN